jgi:cephalosporin hydroxylase
MKVREDWKEVLVSRRAEQCLVGTAFLLDLVEKLEPVVYVETGCAHLATFDVYSSCLPSYGQAIGIDIRMYPDWDTHQWRNKEDRLICGDLRTEMTRNELALTLKGCKIDVAFIDGGHQYDEVLADWEAIKPHLRHGSLVIFHDYDPVAVFRDGHTDGQGAAMVCAEIEKTGQKVRVVPESAVGTAYLYWGER